MTNHIHLLITPSSPKSPSNLMKGVNQRYVRYINRIYKRSGTLWEGRFYSCITHEDLYVLGCYRYIELNPVRASMVNHPANYPWSSYAANAQCADNIIIQPHPLYLDLGISIRTRADHYRDLFRAHLDSGLVDQIRSATRGNFALGSDLFANQVSQALKVRALPGKPGRPKKSIRNSKFEMVKPSSDNEIPSPITFLPTSSLAAWVSTQL